MMFVVGTDVSRPCWHIERREGRDNADEQSPGCAKADPICIKLRIDEVRIVPVLIGIGLLTPPTHLALPHCLMHTLTPLLTRHSSSQRLHPTRSHPAHRCCCLDRTPMRRVPTVQHHLPLLDDESYQFGIDFAHNPLSLLAAPGVEQAFLFPQSPQQLDLPA